MLTAYNNTTPAIIPSKISKKQWVAFELDLEEQVGFHSTGRIQRIGEKGFSERKNSTDKGMKVKRSSVDLEAWI